MSDITVRMAAMPSLAIDYVRALEAESSKLPQVEIKTEHAFHAGMYSRTIIVPRGVVLTGALIKIPTILIISGDAIVHTSLGPERIVGYHVVLAPKNRKQAFYALNDTFLTMIFPTSSKSVEEAESEFTDEFNNLLSRTQGA